MKPSEAYPLAGGFYVQTDPAGGVLVCPAHADVYMETGIGIRALPRSRETWNDWARISSLTNACTECEAEHQGLGPLAAPLPGQTGRRPRRAPRSAP